MDHKSFFLGLATGAKASGGGGSDITVESLNVTQNGTITAPTGKAYSPVITNVPNTYVAADEGKVVSDGALVAQTAHAKVTQNGTIDTTLNDSVEIDVPGAPQRYIEIVQTNNAGIPQRVAVHGIVNMYPYMFYRQQGLTEVILPSTMESLGEYAFAYCNTMPNMPQIPQLVTAIPTYCFDHCSALTEITVPEQITSIGSYAFRDCNLVQNLYFNAISPINFTSSTVAFGGIGTNTVNGTEVVFGAQVKRIPSRMFYSSGTSNTVKVHTVTMGNAVESIGSYAFNNTSSLTSVSLSSSLIDIESYAFFGCSNLTAIQLPATLENIGASAFQNCQSIAAKVSVPQKVQEIGNYAFKGMTACPSIELHDGSLTSIGASAFADCTNLKSMYVPGNCRISYNATTGTAGAFCNCTGLKSVVIGGEGNPTDDAKFSVYTFANCTQAGLLMVIYTQGGASISKAPFGATNATIVYRDSDETRTAVSAVYDSASSSWRVPQSDTSGYSEASGWTVGSCLTIDNAENWEQASVAALITSIEVTSQHVSFTFTNTGGNIANGAQADFTA